MTTGRAALQQIERRHHRLIKYLAAADIPEAMFLVQRGAGPPCRGYMHKPDRITVFVGFGSGHPGDGHRNVRDGTPKRAFRHGAGDRFTDRALPLEQSARNAERNRFLVLGISDEAALQLRGGARRFRQHSGQQTTGAGFRRDDAAAALLRVLNDLGRTLDERGIDTGKFKFFLHSNRIVAWRANAAIVLAFLDNR